MLQSIISRMHVGSIRVVGREGRSSERFPMPRTGQRGSGVLQSIATAPVSSSGLAAPASIERYQAAYIHVSISSGFGRGSSLLQPVRQPSGLMGELCTGDRHSVAAVHYFSVDRGPRSNLSSQTVTGLRPCTNQTIQDRDRRSDRGPQC